MDDVFEKTTKQEQKLQQLEIFHKNDKGEVNKVGNKKVNNNTNFTNSNTRQNFDRNRSDGHPGPRDGCYNCGGNHYASNYLQRSTTQRGRNQQGASLHLIHTTVDNCQADFQASPIQVTSKLFGHSVSILIDTGANECFIDPKIVSRLSIRPGYMSHAWMVQYGNQAKKRVDSCLFCSDLELPNFQTWVNLYVAPLGSYDVILGISWLIEHKALVNYADKVVSCLDYTGNSVEIHGSKRPLELKHISAMQLKKSQRKGCTIVVVMVSDLDNAKKIPKDYLVLKEFLDFFPKDLIELPPKREFDFSIELLPGIEPQSRLHT
ncbi:uncharacterized protein LOC131066084 [Cryptomeria japonica]|uniref:uncharacterized protein LOC131066084 n=1 Tax=Cryptomeria japonica TaxID=3369 RepID=UPI0027DA8A64|nr:uncharacterized protein LOC131066084 [Cryptomeria japonica]